MDIVGGVPIKQEVHVTIILNVIGGGSVEYQQIPYMESVHKQKEYKMKNLILTICLILPKPVIACWYDIDCDIGFTCVKDSGYEEGVCVGKKYRNTPPNDSSYPKEPKGYWNKNKGNSCSYDAQCDVGEKCLKSDFSLYGVCS